MAELLLLFVAGVLGGVLNSVAGGGSFITFPALLFVGVPPIVANATNTFASCAGYLSGSYAFRRELAGYRQQLLQIVPLCLVGGALGAWLLVQTPEQLFTEVIPWLLLFATLLFVFGGRINTGLKRLSSNQQSASIWATLALALLLLIVSIYGGFFNAGLGIVGLSYLALAGYRDINVMNGIKLLISSAVSVTAIVLFVVDGVIAWREGTAVLLGTLVGGYVAAHVSKRLPQQWVRAFVIAVSWLITLYFFVKTYL